MGNLQAGILEWGCHALLQGSSQLRDRTCVSCGSYITGGSFTAEPLGNPTYHQGPGEFDPYFSTLVFPGGSEVKSICLQCGRPGFDPWVRNIPWRRKWQPTPVFLPGESHGRRSLVGYSPWGRKKSDTTERLHLLIYLIMLVVFVVCEAVVVVPFLEWCQTAIWC